MATISGILIDGAGQALPNVQIVLTALKTSSKVLNQSKALITTTSETGTYSINAQVGQYAVTVLRNGFPVERVGEIEILVNSANGSLNDFLLLPKVGQTITPEVLAQITDERKLAQTAATNAQNSANNAANTLAGAVKRTGDTMTGALIINASYPQVQFKTAVNQHQIRGNPAGDFYFYLQDLSETYGIRLRYSAALNRWDFYADDVLINNLPALKQGDGGILSAAKVFSMSAPDFKSSFMKILSADTDNPNQAGGDVIGFQTVVSASNNAYATQFVATNAATRQYRAFGRAITNESSVGSWVEFITSANSTVSSNGTLMSASPILRLYAEKPEVVDGYTLAGCGLVNSEAQGVTAKRIDIGHYEIHGSLGFAKEGWYITLPEDANGNKKIFAEYLADENNVITIKTYTKKFDFEKCEVVAGEPIDITDGRWIDLRLEMPVVEIIEQEEPIPSTLNPIVSEVSE